MSTVTRGPRVILESRGAGPAVLFLHGTPTPWDILRPVAQACRNRRTLVAALPGYGDAPPWTSSTSVRTIAEAIELAVIEEGVRDLAVVGFSGGAYHALHLATRKNLRIDRVFVIGGFAELAMVEREAFLGFAGMLRSGSPIRGIATQRFLSPEFAAKHPAACERVEGWIPAAHPESLAFELEALAHAPSLASSLAEFDGKIVARTGELDLAVPPDKARQIVSIARQGQLQIVRGCGHALLEEDGDETVATILDLVADGSAPGSMRS